MEHYQLSGDTYIMKEYDKIPAFSSFLPSLAGIKGIPLWAFYTNRGQGINSFGIHNKNNAIMEFNPANTAYENTPQKGYRTFVKSNGQYFEPFVTRDPAAQRNMLIRRNSLTIEEINTRHDIKISVSYFVLPGDSIGALVRKVRIENIGTDTKHLEILDGLPKIIPYGIKNAEYKEMSNLLKSYAEIKNIENRVPYYTLRSSSDDSEEVSEIEGGYFYLGLREGKVLPVIFDPETVFSYDTSLLHPESFLKHSLQEMSELTQNYSNKIPCGFSLLSLSILPGEGSTYASLTGFASTVEHLNEKVKDFCGSNYLEEKEKLADILANQLTKDIRCHTSLPAFDQYMEQNYLDNFLRGGYPFLFNKNTNKAVVHLFSRKHGDPERDYNFFSIAGEYYSQGNGNFRDVSQNRRNDSFFHQEIGDFNIKTFFSLIQIDGYNPLEIRPSTFSVKAECKPRAAKLIAENCGIAATQLLKLTEKPFTPGSIANYIASHSIQASCGEDMLLEQLLECCDQNIEAGFREGYWSDHWDYNMDLIDSYLSIYPERKKELLLGDESYRFYDSPARVLPRSEKYVINQKNEVRQFGALQEDEIKLNRQGFVKNGTNWLKTEAGEYAVTTLLGKMIILSVNKFSSLDSFGMGVEMEGGKPGWNDAMNGLPGLFGSGMAETFELKRMISFLRGSIGEVDQVSLPQEAADFLRNTYQILQKSKEEGWTSFAYWDKVSSLREQYRDKVRFTICGTYQELKAGEVFEILRAFEEKLEEGIHKADTYGEGIIPTYFSYRAIEFEPVFDDKGNPVISHYGLQKAVVKQFEVQPLPHFLEGPAKMLGSLNNREEAEKLYRNVRGSRLFDRKLGMYKTCVPLEQISMENGRVRAFTPGWQERESIFLHMEYKYLLSVLRAGLYEHFYEDIRTALVVFRDPGEYGRSILENSSFLASSENPDPKVHGRGFVARLSGSTTEAISLWIEMFIGRRIFVCDNGQLQLRFEPKLPGWLFDEAGEISFPFLSVCEVTYHNPGRRDTFGPDAAKIYKIRIADTTDETLSSCISGELAWRIRNGGVKKIDIYLQ